MIQFFQKIIILVLCIASTNTFSQENTEVKNPIKSMFTLGTGFYSFQGDIVGDESNYLSGNIAYNAGMRFNINDNLDLSFLITGPLDLVEEYKGEDGEVIIFRSTFLRSFGAQLDVDFDNIFKNSRIHPFASIGIMSTSFKTLNNSIDPSYLDKETSIGLPVGFGLMLDVTEKMRFDASLKYVLNTADIDHSVLMQSDNYIVLNFAIHYDLFTKDKNVNNYNQKYYSDVDYEKLDIADGDGDLVADIDDFCPKTPAGVKVDQNGCPLDDDADGIANYLDKEKNSDIGSIVDENGVKLSDDKYFSIYSEVDPASREYSDFYNENEISRDDFKSLNAYLIAKANAFNKLYQSTNNDDFIGVKYKVFLSQFAEGVPARVINKLLSIDDLESISQDDGNVIYAVGNYLNVDEALNREFNLEQEGFKNLDILQMENGILTIYRPQINNTEDLSSEEVLNEQLNDSSELKSDEEVVSDQSTGTVYRVQIGAYKVVLNSEVFSGVKNVISFKGNDGLVRYMTGSFNDYKNAVLYSKEMKARGFNDAFIVTYENGERVALSTAIKGSTSKANREKITAKRKSRIDKKQQDKSAVNNVSFRIQIGVFSETLSADDLEKMSKISNISKESSGNFYKYYSSDFMNYNDALTEMEIIKSFGFATAFITARDGTNLISIEKARGMSNNK
jgi:opacity protein-like surface antigen